MPLQPTRPPSRACPRAAPPRQPPLLSRPCFGWRILLPRSQDRRLRPRAPPPSPLRGERRAICGAGATPYRTGSTNSNGNPGPAGSTSAAAQTARRGLARRRRRPGRPAGAYGPSTSRTAVFAECASRSADSSASHGVAFSSGWPSDLRLLRASSVRRRCLAAGRTLPLYGRAFSRRAFAALGWQPTSRTLSLAKARGQPFRVRVMSASSAPWPPLCLSNRFASYLVGAAAVRPARPTSSTHSAPSACRARCCSPPPRWLSSHPPSGSGAHRCPTGKKRARPPGAFSCRRTSRCPCSLPIASTLAPVRRRCFPVLQHLSL